MKTPFSFFARITLSLVAFLFIFAAAFSQTAFAVLLPTVSSATIQNSNSSTVDIAISGANFDRFFDSQTDTADSTDLSHIHYNGNVPTSATITSSIVTATFPIAAGTYKSGGALTLAAGTLANGTLSHNTATLSVANGSITDSAKPIVVISDIDGAALDGGTTSPQPVQITFSEPVTTPTVSVSPDGGSQSATDCGDANAATWCFDYAIPSANTTETITISGADDLATSPNVMDSDGNHTFTVSPYENMLDIVGDMVNYDAGRMEIVVPSTGPTLQSFWYSGTATADGTDLEQFTYNDVHPNYAFIDTDNNTLDLVFYISVSGSIQSGDITTAPAGDLDILPASIVSNDVGNDEDFVPEELITDDASPVIVFAQAQNDGGSTPTTAAQLTLSENVQDVDGGDQTHPNFAIYNASTNQQITITGADIAESSSDNHVDIVLDTSDPDDYDGPLNFSYDSGASGTKILDAASNEMASVTNYSVEEANDDYGECTSDCGGGGGGGPTDISSCADFENINDDLSGSYELDSDLDCTDESNDIMVGSAGSPFTGTFDGDGHKITIHLSSTDNDIGLFRRISGGTISRLWVSGVIGVSTQHGTGAIAGVADSGATISQVTSDATITSDYYNIGGLVGEMSGGATLENSYFSGSVSGNINIGGLVGNIDDATIKYSYSNGTVSGDSFHNAVGGIAGLADGNSTITSTLTAGTISSPAGVFGTFTGGEFAANNVADNFWDYPNTTITSCASNWGGGNQGQCQGNPGFDFDYYKGNNDNDPLSNWNFNSIWQTQDGGYPILRSIIRNAPGQVTGLSADAESSSEIDLSWTAPTDAGSSAITGYMIERESPDDGGFSTLVSNTGNTDTTYDDTGLSSNTQYNYRVSAISGVGTGTASSTADATTNLSIPFSGSGTSMDPYQVSSCDDLAAIGINFNDADFVLESDLDCSTNTNAVIIGSGSSPFAGTFDGNGHKITVALTGSADDVGLFSYVNGGTVENLWVDGTVDGGSNNNVGGVVGFLNGTVTDVKSTVTITGTGSAYGGLVGNTFAANINNSYFDGSVSGGVDVGGIAGAFFGGNYSNDYAVGTVAATGNNIGGIAGIVSSGPTVTHNFAVAAVSGGGSNIGGAFGQNSGGTAYTDNWWDINASGTSDDVGSDNTISGITGVNSDGTDANHFKNDDTNAPLSSWTFPGTWTARSGNYPELTIFVVAAAPGQVTELSADAISSSEIDLSWTAPADNGSSITGYRIERESPDGDGWSDLVSDTGNTDTDYDDTGLSASTQYNYRVSAINAIGTGTASDAADATTNDDGGGGSPTSVSSCADFENINNDLSGSYALTGNLDCTGEGNNIMIGADSPFSGTFDGGGYTMTIALDDTDGSIGELGLFAQANDATINDLTVAGSVEGQNEMGALVADADGVSFTNDHSSATVMVDENNSSGENAVGGLVGALYDDSTLSGSSATGTVSATGSTVFLGGLVGVQQGAGIQYSHASGNVSSTNSDLGCGVGGLIGCIIGGETIQSYATGLVSAVGGAGGFAGEIISSLVVDSYATGNVSGDGGIGGFVGFVQDGSEVVNTYASGAVTGDNGAITGDQQGGFSGAFSDSEIDNSFSIGLVSNVAGTFGGFIGEDEGNTVYQNDFYDQLASGQAGCTQGSDVEGCTGVNTSGSPDANYFLGNSTNPPFAIEGSPAWDFADTPVWDVVSGQLPLLHGEHPTSGTTGHIRVTVSDLSGTVIPGADVQVACPAWGSFQDIGTTDGDGVIEFDPTTISDCSPNPISIKATKDGYINAESDDLSAFDSSIDPDASEGNNYSIAMIPNFDGSGSGTSEDPYLIASCTQLEGIVSNLSADYRLSQNIDCTGLTFQPIAVGMGQYFSGIFDGNNKTISNVTVDEPDTDPVAIFGQTQNATFENLALDTIDMTGAEAVGALIGYADQGLTMTGITATNSAISATDGDVGGLVGDFEAYNETTSAISNVSFDGTVSSQGEDTGGIFGYLEIDGDNATVTIDHPSVSGTIGSDSEELGGIVGEADVDAENGDSGTNASALSITNATMSADIVGDTTNNGAYAVGGIIGFMRLDGSGAAAHATLSNNTVTGDISGDGNMGGIAGGVEDDDGGSDAIATLDANTVSGNVTGNQGFVGGLVGYAYIFGQNATTEQLSTTISNSSMTGNVSGLYFLGGIIGGTAGEGPFVDIAGTNANSGLLVQNDFSTGTVVSTDEGGQGNYVGGLVGYLSCFSTDSAQSYGCHVEDSYASGNVSGDEAIGGLFGVVEDDVSVTDSYARGNVSGEEELGGLIGLMNAYGTNMSISNTYASGNIHATSDGLDYGGLIGQTTIIDGGTSTVSHSFSVSNMSFGTGEDSGWLIGDSSGTAPSDLWYAPNPSDLSLPCYGDTDATTGCSVPDGDTTFFQNSTTNGPLANWDFATAPVWVMHADDYPTLSGLGGGDEGGEGESGPVPTVTDVTPGDEATDVSVDTNTIVATFSEPMNTGSVEVSMLPCGDGGCPSFNTSWNEGDTVLTVTITDPQPLAANTRYIIHITGNSADGVSMENEVASAFTTGSADDTETQAPTLSLPQSGYTYGDTNPLDVDFSLPEDMLAGSLTLTFTPSEGDPVVLHLRDAESGRSNPFQFTPSDLNGVDEIISVDGDATSIPDGTYTVALSYQDSHGNTAANASVTDVVIGPTANVPLLTEVTPIASSTSAANAVYTFSNSESDGDYVFDEITQSGGGSVATHMDPVSHQVTFTGLQAGVTYSTSFEFVTSDHHVSNTLDVGPFTVTGNPSSGGSSGGGGGGGGYVPPVSSSSGACPTGYVCIPNAGAATTGTALSGTGGGYHFPRNLKLNVKTGDDVAVLQKFLNSHGFIVAKSGAGSPGHETKTFGSATKIALMKFQKANGLNPDGILGPITRAAIEAIMNK